MSVDVSSARARRLAPALALFAFVACKSREEAAPAAAANTSASERALAAKKLEIPRDQVVAASTHLRFVDVGQGQVVGGVDIGRAITDLAFSRDGLTAYVAASDGVRAVDLASRQATAKLTGSPARQLTLSTDGRTLSVLEHDVLVDASGKRTPTPYRLERLTLGEGGAPATKRDTLPIGERVLGVVGPDDGLWSMVMFETGEVRLVPPGRPLSDEGQAIDVARDLGGKRFVVRPYVALDAARTAIFVPVEGEPSRVVRIDRATGRTRSYGLGRATILRGVAVSPDASRLYVSTSDKLVALDAASGEPQGELELEGAHTGLALSADGRRAYLAQTVFEQSGAITAVQLEPLRRVGRIVTDDLSPWVLGVVPRAELAAR